MHEQGWTISVELSTREPMPDDDRAGDLLDALIEHGAAVSMGRDHYRCGGTFSLYRPDLDAPDALAEGLRIFRDAALRVGVPVSDVLWAELSTFAEHDRRLAL